MPATSTNSWTAARICLPPCSTTCLPSSPVISGTITCACTSNVTGSSLECDQGEHAGHHEQSSAPDARVRLLEMPSHHQRSEHERDRHADEVGGEHHRHVGLVERQQPEPRRE